MRPHESSGFMDRRLMIIFGLTASLVAVVLVAVFSGGRSESEILHELLTQKQIELQQKEEMLKAKEALLKEKDVTISAQESQINEDAKILEETNVELDKATYDKEEKEELLEQKESVLKNLTETVTELDKELTTIDESKEDQTLAKEIEFQAKVEEQVQQAPEGRLTNKTEFPEEVHFVKLDGAFSQVNLLAVKAARVIVKPERIYLHCHKEPTGPNWMVAKRMIDEVVLFKPGELDAPASAPGANAVPPMPQPQQPPVAETGSDDDDKEKEEDDSDGRRKKRGADSVAALGAVAAAAAGASSLKAKINITQLGTHFFESSLSDYMELMKARIKVMHDYGGINIDLNSIVLNNMEELLETYEDTTSIVVGEVANGQAALDVVITKPEHQFWKDVIDLQNDNSANGRKFRSGVTPALLSRLLKRYANTASANDKVVVLPFKKYYLWDRITFSKALTGKTSQDTAAAYVLQMFPEQVPEAGNIIDGCKLPRFSNGSLCEILKKLIDA